MTVRRGDVLLLAVPVREVRPHRRDRRRLQPVARPVVAWALIAAAVFGLEALAFSGAPDATGAPIPPRGLPEPRPGDTGEYELAQVQWTPDGLRVLQENRPALRFEWEADRVGWDSSGRERLARSVTVTSARGGPDDGPAPITERFSIDPATGRPLDRFRDVTAGGAGGLQKVEGRPTARWHLTEYFPADGEPTALPCGLHNELQGRLLDAGRTFRWRPCLLADRPVAGVELFAAGAREFDGRPAWAFVDRPPQATGAPPPLVVWVAPDVPYPVAIARALEESPDQYDLLRLARFERGPDPAPKPASTRAALEPLEWAEPRPWGPDDEGVDHPFPLSEAFRVARESPVEPDLRNFLAAHPDAFTESAHHRSTLILGAPGQRLEEFAWDFTVTGGRERIRVEVTRILERVAAPKEVAAAGLPDPGTLLAVHDPGNVTVRPLEDDAGSQPPTLDRLPRQLPTVRSLARWWGAYLGPDVEGWRPNNWGFNWSCAAGCTTGGAFWIGPVQSASPPVGPRESPPSIEATLVLDADGRVRALWEHADAPVSPTRAFGAAAKAKSLDDWLATPPTPAALLAPGALPTAREVGLLALVLGFLLGWRVLLETLGPRLAALFPFYSRLERPRLLDHPVRARLAALVELQPGIHFQELGRRLGLGSGPLQHHLRALERGRVLSRFAGAGYTCYFVRGRVPRRRMPWATVLKSDGARRLLSALAPCASATVPELTGATGLGRTPVRFHLRRLVEAGVVVRREADRPLRYELSDAGRSWIEAPGGRGPAARPP